MINEPPSPTYVLGAIGIAGTALGWFVRVEMRLAALKHDQEASAKVTSTMQADIKTLLEKQAEHNVQAEGTRQTVVYIKELLDRQAGRRH